MGPLDGWGSALRELIFHPPDWTVYVAFIGLVIGAGLFAAFVTGWVYELADWRRRRHGQPRPDRWSDRGVRLLAAIIATVLPRRRRRRRRRAVSEPAVNPAVDDPTDEIPARGEPTFPVVQPAALPVRYYAHPLPAAYPPRIADKETAAVSEPDPGLVKQPTATPTRKVAAGGIGSAVVVVGLAVAAAAGVELPDGLAVEGLPVTEALVALVGFATAYFTRSRTT